jgi:hypothetical protein
MEPNSGVWAQRPVRVRSVCPGWNREGHGYVQAGVAAERMLPLMRNLGRVRISRDVLDGHTVYGVLLGDAANTGCCPIWVSDGGLRSLDVPDDPQAVLGEIDQRDTAGVLAERWPGACPFACGCRPPFDAEFPGLVTPPALVGDAVGMATRFAGERWWSHLAVVPVSRPADVVAALGWRAPSTITATSPASPRCCAAGRTASARCSSGRIWRRCGCRSPHRLRGSGSVSA